MNAYIRYRVINSLLEYGGSATIKQMISACENALDIKPIGKRTIEGDIAAMRKDPRLEFFAPIEYKRQDKVYIYKDPDYSIDRFPLSNEEVQTLRFAATILRQFRHIEYLKQFEGTVQKIVDAIRRSDLADTDPDMSFIHFEKSPLIRGTEYLQELIEHIQEKHVLKLKYRKFDNDEEKDYTVHPYLLKEYRNRWYLVGYHEEDSMFKIFGLERLMEIHRMFMKTYLTKIVDFERFFKNSIGITRYDEEPEEIRIAFTKHQAKYLATQPLHDTQTLLEEIDGRYLFQFNIVPTPEFTATLLGWGDQVEVMSPDWYREEISGMVRRMREVYG